jgi:hypothetical protein
MTATQTELFFRSAIERPERPQWNHLAWSVRFVQSIALAYFIRTEPQFWSGCACRCSVFTDLQVMVFNDLGESNVSKRKMELQKAAVCSSSLFSMQCH